MVDWNLSMEARLRELADQGIQGQDIAARLSAEFGEFFSPDAVFHKAGRLGVSLAGRSLASYEITNEDPFAAPSWLKRDLQNLADVSRFPRPRIIVAVGSDFQQPKDEEIAEKIKNEFHKKWAEYVSHVVASGAASREQAQHALEHPIPLWFKRWCGEPAVVMMWDPDLDSARVEAYAKTRASIDDVKRGLEIEGLLEEGSDLLRESAGGAQVPDPAPPQTDSFTERGPSRGNALHLARQAAQLVKDGPPAPKSVCARCGGSPKWDTTLEEWICKNCGHILRLPT